MIKAIIFDLDNTLTDFMRFKKTAIDAAVDAMIDAGLKVTRKRLLEKIGEVYDSEGIEDQQVFNKVLKKIDGKVEDRILAAGIVGYRKAKEGSMKLYPHVKATLTGLIKSGIKMVIVSDAPRLPAWMRICSLGLQDYFDNVITFDDTGEKKPSSVPFRMALDVLGIPAGEVLMVGDLKDRDIEGAKKVGIKTAFARYGDSKNTEEAGADYELKDISELLDIVKSENSK